MQESHLLEAEQFALQVSDGGVAFVLFLRELPVGRLQFGESGLKLLRAALMSRLQLSPQLFILLLQPRLDLYMYKYTEVLGVSPKPPPLARVVLIMFVSDIIPIDDKWMYIGIFLLAD